LNRGIRTSSQVSSDPADTHVRLARMLPLADTMDRVLFVLESRVISRGVALT
jgi:hypothetical protein